MTLEEKHQVLGLMVTLLQDNVGNRLTQTLIRGLVSTVDENTPFEQPKELPTAPAADAGTPS